MARKKGKLDKKGAAPSKSLSSRPESSEVAPPETDQSFSRQSPQDKVIPQGKEALKNYIQAGGQKCLDLFQYLSTRQYGTLPPLSEEEAEMLNDMYNVWVQCQADGDDSLSHEAIQDTENDSSNSAQTVSVSTCLTAIKESISTHPQHNESLSIVVSQLDILMKASEPTRTHANDLLEVLMSSEFMARDVDALEHLSIGTTTRTAYGSACSIVLALLADSEHILPSASVSGSYLSSHGKRPYSADSYDSATMFYYARAASFNDRPNPIACMQLGVKYLKGFRVTVEADTAAASPAQPMLDKAFEWFKRAAVLQNPIAQHKMGYFYDEGLPGVCGVDIMEAVRWYSQAAELMPDSMHNLAKIYEDGRGGFKSNIEQAVTLYSVAAARGFPLSQVNLGRLFLLGEDGVARDRDAGKRLLTLAAESGDADAQMVVGMIHATPAFECYNLALSEHWLRLSLAGGKKDAERMLVRVCQQIAQNKQQELERRQRGDPSVDNDGLDDGLGMQEQEQIGKPISLDAAAAKLRGDDFRSHGLLHAAVLEYSRAFELDKQKLVYFVDRLEALAELNHYDECLTDSSLLLMCVDSSGAEHSGARAGCESRLLRGRQDKTRVLEPSSISASCGGGEATGDEDAMNRLYDILAESLGVVFCAGQFPLARAFVQDSAEKGDVVDNYNSLFEQMVGRPSTSVWSQSSEDKTQAQMSTSEKDYQRRCQQQHAEEYMFNLDNHHKECLISRLLQECLGWTAKSVRSSAFLARLTSYGKYYDRTVVKLGGVLMLLSVLLSSPPPVHHVCGEGIAGAEATGNSSRNATVPTSTSSQLIVDQVRLNCVIILHNLSFSGASRSVLHMYAAADGFEALCGTLRRCRHSVSRVQTITFRGMVMARTSTTVLQILLNVACVADARMWESLLTAGLIAAVTAALECTMSASLLENYSLRLSADFAVTGGYAGGGTKQFSAAPQMASSWVEEADRLLVDTVHCSARLFKVSPLEVLLGAAKETTGVFQRILVALSSINPSTEHKSLGGGLKSAAAFCLCKLLCAHDPKNAELLQRSLSAEGMRDLMLTQNRAREGCQSGHSGATTSADSGGGSGDGEPERSSSSWSSSMSAVGSVSAESGDEN